MPLIELTRRSSYVKVVHAAILHAAEFLLRGRLVIPALPVLANGSSDSHRMDLVLGASTAHLRLGGEIDLVAAPELRRLLAKLDPLPITIHVDLSDVTFLDISGVQPLVEAAIRRRQRRFPPVLIGECSRAARRLLDIVQLGGKPHLSVAAWDRLATPALIPGPRDLSTDEELTTRDTAP
jgi:anti-anti-sigma factor